MARHTKLSVLKTLGPGILKQVQTNYDLICLVKSTFKETVMS